MALVSQGRKRLETTLFDGREKWSWRWTRLAGWKSTAPPGTWGVRVEEGRSGWSCSPERLLHFVSSCLCRESKLQVVICQEDTAGLQE